MQLDANALKARYNEFFKHCHQWEARDRLLEESGVRCVFLGHGAPSPQPKPLVKDYIVESAYDWVLEAPAQYERWVAGYRAEPKYRGKHLANRARQ